MRLVIARCSVDYVGRLDAHLPAADRLIMVKSDGSVSVHADNRAYKPLNWMTSPCTLAESPITDIDGEDTEEKLWVVENPKVSSCALLCIAYSMIRATILGGSRFGQRRGGSAFAGIARGTYYDAW